MALSAFEMSFSPGVEETEELPSPFANIPAIVCDHSYLPTCFGSLVDNALVYISGFVVRQVLKCLSCDMCRGSLVSDAIPPSFDQSYHLLTLKNKGVLMIPSEGTVKVVRSAFHLAVNITTSRQSGLDQSVCLAEIGSEDVFFSWGAHSGNTVWN